MARVDAFNKGRAEKDDEYYTRYEDIQSEINHYEKYFKNKVVLCNCDDPYESNFCKFFLKNFNYLGLKRLICTSYYSSPVLGMQLSLYDEENKPLKAGNAYVLDVSEVPMSNGRGVSDDDIDRLLKSKRSGVKKLKGDGDFRSRECIEYLKKADIVVTNPPFSKFIEFVSTLISYKKQFLIIGRETAVSYKEVFPLLKGNEIWFGYTHVKEFFRPDGTTKKFGNVLWYTNLDVTKRHEDIVLYKTYDEEEYPKYENYDGIDVASITDIPKDYYGNMGLPVSFMNSYNPEQFEIVGYGKGELGKSIGVTKNYRGRSDLAICVNGKHSCPFSRIIIRRKK